MKEDSFWTIVRTDINRCRSKKTKGIFSTLKCLYYYESLVIIVLFRFIQRIKQLKIPLLPGFLKFIYKNLSVFLGVRLDLRANIGKGFYIGHYGGVFVGPVKIGKYCNLNQQVTLGKGGRGTEREGVPEIGDYVWIGPGAKIYGRFKIGNNVSIAANVVVSKDIPDNSIVVGNPGRVVGYQEKNIYLDNVDKISI